MMVKLASGKRSSVGTHQQELLNFRRSTYPLDPRPIINGDLTTIATKKLVIDKVDGGRCYCSKHSLLL